MKTELYNLAYSIQAQIDHDKAFRQADPVAYFASTYPKMFLDNVKKSIDESKNVRQFKTLLKKYCKLTKSGIDGCEVCQYYISNYKK